MRVVSKVVHLRRVGIVNTPSDRWRVVLSDGRHTVQTMLATQKNFLLNEGTIQELCFVKITEYLVNVVQSKK